MIALSYGRAPAAYIKWHFLFSLFWVTCQHPRHGTLKQFFWLIHAEWLRVYGGFGMGWRRGSLFMINCWRAAWCLGVGGGDSFSWHLLCHLLCFVVLKNNQHHIWRYVGLASPLASHGAVELRSTETAWGANMQHFLPCPCVPPLLLFPDLLDLIPIDCNRKVNFFVL